MKERRDPDMEASEDVRDVPRATRHPIGPRFLLLMLLACLLISAIPPATASGEGMTIKGVLLEEGTDEPVVNATVTLSYTSNGTVLATTTTDEGGTFWFLVLLEGEYTVSAAVEGYLDWSRNVTVDAIPYGDPMITFTGHLTPSSYGGGGDEPSPFPASVRYGALLSIGIIASLVMYSKIKRENLLRHAVRKRIYDYVKEHPGHHYRAILADLELPMGTLTYHLNRLEKAEYLKSRQDGMHRRFYVSGRRTEVRFFLSDIQESIVAVIRANQGISQSRIADEISVSRKVVNYHVRILDQAGLIYVEPCGRETACYVVDRAPGVA